MTIKVERTLPFNIDAVWAIVGTPERVDWVPGVSGCDFDGRYRKFKMSGAGSLTEEIFSRDEALHRIEYGVVDSPMPLTEHRASITLDRTEDGCRLTWETSVEPAAVESFIHEAMEASLIQLISILETQPSS